MQAIFRHVRKHLGDANESATRTAIVAPAPESEPEEEEEAEAEQEEEEDTEMYVDEGLAGAGERETKEIDEE